MLSYYRPPPLSPGAKPTEEDVTNRLVTQEILKRDRLPYDAFTSRMQP
jgi:hypothetical protein